MLLAGSKGGLDIATDADICRPACLHCLCSRVAIASSNMQPAARAAAAIPCACIRYTLLEADPSIAFGHLSRLGQTLVAATLAL